MQRRTCLKLAVIGMVSLGIAGGVWAGKSRVKFYSGSGIGTMDFLGFTYRNVIDGYPPQPRIEIILGDDSEAIKLGPYSGFKYECVVDAYQHTPGESYPWRMIKYTDATKTQLEDWVWASGTATATALP